jgi:Mg2+ and Co2+ transporter CorA
MSKQPNVNFSNIIRQIIKKSLFTERQIEIILKRRNLLNYQFDITKGAFYRQVGQCRNKLQALYYTWILLQAMDVIRGEDMDVINRLSEQVSVIKSSDVFPEREEEVMSVIEELLNRTTKL